MLLQLGFRVQLLCNVDWAEVNGMMALPGPLKSLMVYLAVWIQCDVQTDGRTLVDD